MRAQPQPPNHFPNPCLLLPSHFACFSAVSCFLQAHGLWPTRLLCPWDSPGKNTGMGCHFLLQGIFPTQGWNLHFLHWEADSLLLSQQGPPHWGLAIQHTRFWGHSLACCSPWGRKESDTTERLNWTDWSMQSAACRELDSLRCSEGRVRVREACTRNPGNSPGYPLCCWHQWCSSWEATMTSSGRNKSRDHVFLKHQVVKVLVAQSLLTLWPHGL